MRVHLRGKEADINSVFRNEWKELEKAFNHSLEIDEALKNGASLEYDYSCKWESGKPNMLYDSLYLVFIFYSMALQLSKSREYHDHQPSHNTSDGAIHYRTVPMPACGVHGLTGDRNLQQCHS